MSNVKRRAKKAANTARVHVKNTADAAKGKATTLTGKALNNKKVEVKGHLERAKAKAKQAGQQVKEVVED
ncbi:MAG TPA: hypothetical protein VMF33_02145 [Acidimicrobiales bacterium]|nr:hypothetical protein [Acidimicrobiales bacterium]